MAARLRPQGGSARYGFFGMQRYTNGTTTRAASGDRRRRHLHRPDARRRRRRHGDWSTRSPAPRPTRREATMTGLQELCALAASTPGDLDQLLHGTTVATNIVLERNGSTHGDDHDPRLPRHHLHRSPPPPEDVLDLPGPPVARADARRAARHRLAVTERVVPPRRRPRPARRGRGARGRAHGCATPGVEAVAVCFLFSFLNPRPRAARQGDPRGGAAGRPPLDQPRGRAPAPRVRALLDHRAERVHRPEDQPLPAPHARRAARDRARHGLPPDGLQRRHADRRRRRVARRPQLLMSGPVAGHRRRHRRRALGRATTA